MGTDILRSSTSPDQVGWDDIVTKEHFQPGLPLVFSAAQFFDHTGAVDSGKLVSVR
jgi:hypothetical protein